MKLKTKIKKSILYKQQGITRQRGIAKGARIIYAWRHDRTKTLQQRGKKKLYIKSFSLWYILCFMFRRALCYL